MAHNHPRTITGIRRIASGIAGASLLVALALAIVGMPSHADAFASEPQLQVGQAPQLTQSDTQSNDSSKSDEQQATATQADDELTLKFKESLAAVEATLDTDANLVLKYDLADIAAIGNQNESGHTICCPSFACAYADAVLDGTVHDHDYYTCSCCSWTDWGGGNSSYRCVGTDEEVLREAYDQIKSGKPVVTHVSWEYGEHWIALIGYRNVEDPNHLTLDNFIALNPSDGAQIVASDGYALYGDGCQHVSER